MIRRKNLQIPGRETPSPGCIGESFCRDGMVLHKEQERIYRELMRKVSVTKSPAGHEVTHHDHGSPGSLDGDVEALSARAIELEHLRNALSAEKIRAEAAEQEFRSVLGEKDRAMEDLGQRLREITENAEHQAQENLWLADELAAEQLQRAEAEQKVEMFRQEMEQRETARAAEQESRELFDVLQQKFDALTGSFEAERQKSSSLESGLLGLNATLRQQEEDIRTLNRRLEEATAAAEKEMQQRISVEKNLNETVRARDEELQALRSEDARLREELDVQKKALDLVLREQEAERSAGKDIGDELAAAVLALAESEKQAKSISGRRNQPQGETGNKDRLKRSPGNPALIHRDRGELDRAMKLLKEEERISRERGNKDALQSSLGKQALIYRDRGEPDLAMKLHKEEERICRETGNRDGLQRSLGNQAVIHRDRGEFDRAMKLHKEKERICREVGNKKGIAISLVNQAGIFVYEQKDPASALPLLEEAYRIAVSSGFDNLVEQLKIHLEKVRKMGRDPHN